MSDSDGLLPLDQVQASRVYTFTEFGEIRLSGVTHFVADPDGTHRLKTQDGKLHLVPPRWLHVEIELVPAAA